MENVHQVLYNYSSHVQIKFITYAPTEPGADLRHVRRNEGVEHRIRGTRRPAKVLHGGPPPGVVARVLVVRRGTVCADGEPDGDGGGVPEGLPGRRHGVGDGDFDVEGKGHRAGEEARRAGWEEQSRCVEEGFWGDSAGDWVG